MNLQKEYLIFNNARVIVKGLYTSKYALMLK